MWQLRYFSFLALFQVIGFPLGFFKGVKGSTSKGWKEVWGSNFSFQKMGFTSGENTVGATPWVGGVNNLRGPQSFPLTFKPEKYGPHKVPLVRCCRRGHTGLKGGNLGENSRWWKMQRGLTHRDKAVGDTRGNHGAH